MKRRVYKRYKRGRKKGGQRYHMGRRKRAKRKSYLTKKGQMILTEKTLKKLKTKVRSIDRRLKGKRGKTKKGKIIMNPRAYVFGGVRKTIK